MNIWPKIILIAFLLPEILKAQGVQNSDTIIYENRIWREGIYFSFDEFKSNMPSYDLPFIIKKRTNRNIEAWGGSKYKMIYTHHSTYDSLGTKTIWAVCDGEGIFINNNLISKNRGYNKLERFSYPYSYFIGYVVSQDEAEDYTPDVLMVSMTAIIDAVASSSPYRRVTVIDMNNGDVIRLNEAGMTRLLQNEPELLNRYRKIINDPDCEEKIIEIVETLNSKVK